MDLLRVSGLRKLYGDILALDGLDFEVDEREIFTIVGPSGSGKSTLLRLVAGIERPTSGVILYRGVPIDRIRDYRRRRAMLLQRSVLFRGSVFDNIAYGLRIRGYHEREVKKRVGRVIDLLGLSGLEGRDVRELSGGERRRVSMGMVAVLDIELALLDEPTLNLDPESAMMVEDAIRWMRDKGVTVLLVTHDPFFASRLASRVALLIDGRLEGIGDRGMLFPLSAISRGCNTFLGEAREVGDVSEVRIGDVTIDVLGRLSGQVRIYIDPGSILVSKAPIRSSARNVLRGRVVGMEDMGGSVELRIDAGIDLIARITKGSYERLGIGMGSKVYVAFKASSVKAFELGRDRCPA